jgi:hypothetical protein
LYLTVDSPIRWEQRCSLGPYVAKSLKIFVCPADNKLSKNPRGVGSPPAQLRHERGDGRRFKVVCSNQLGGAWPPSTMQKKLSDMHNPGPSDCWVIMDEHPNSDDDATFFVNPADANGTGTSFTELPGSMHAKAAG